MDRRTVLVALAWIACLTLTAGAAHAGEELHLSWDACDSDAGAAHNRTFDCVDAGATHVLHAAFTLAAPVDSVFGLEVVVDLQSASTTLPDWWRLDGTGCRTGALSADLLFGTTSCAPAFGPTALASFPSYTVGMPRGGTNQARIKVGVGVSPDQAVTLLAGTPYQAVRLKITSASTATCTGCATGTCLVLNSILLKRPPSALGGNVYVLTPGPGAANWATWQGDGSDCAAVPVRAVTWGAIKALYR